jgi:hypothetical protein
MVDGSLRAFRMIHSLTLRTSPGRSASDFRVSVSRRRERVATKFAGITPSTAATASAFATAATHSDLPPSGAVTSTMGILVRTLCIFRICSARRAAPDAGPNLLKISESLFASGWEAARDRPAAGSLQDDER